VTWTPDSIGIVAIIEALGERMLRVHTRLSDDRKKSVMQFYDRLTYERQLSLP
jgi:hypothetical protein